MAPEGAGRVVVCEQQDDGACRWDGGVVLVGAQRLSEAGTSSPDPVPAQLPDRPDTLMTLYQGLSGWRRRSRNQFKVLFDFSL